VKLIGVVFAERLLYLPSAFVLILAAIGVVRRPRRATAVIVTMIVVALGVRTVTYAARWNDLVSFYRRSLDDSPKAARLHVLLARQLIDRGDVAGAGPVIEEGLTYAPDYWKLWAQAARVAIEQGRLDEAQAFIDRAWTLNPEILELFAVQERLQEARRAATRPR
jgi:Flp pilus assembly protein TadD